MSLDLEPINELHRKIQEKLSSMISAKDLRVGNKIYLELGLPGFNVHEMMPQDIADIADGRITLASIEGIPLTPEILEKCGFEKDEPEECGRPIFSNWEGYAGWAKFQIGKTANEDWCFFINGKFVGCNFQFLHQLQNLFFALTDEELIVKL